MYTFPTSDPDFSFVLNVDPEDLRRMEGEYRPSPYSKLLVGLAEMGVLASDLASAGLSHALGRKSKGGQDGSGGWKGMFQPFDAPSLEEFADMAAMDEREEEEVEEQVDEVEEEEAEAPRTTSRFEFARPVSRATSFSLSRGQSPFNLRANTQIRHDVGEGSSGSVASGSGGSRLIWPPHMQHQQQSAQLAEQVANAGTGHYHDSPSTERSWPLAAHAGMDLSRPPSHRPFEEENQAPQQQQQQHPSHHSPLVHSFNSHPLPPPQSGPFPIGLTLQQQQSYTHGPLPSASGQGGQGQTQAQRQYDARSLQAFHQQAAMRGGNAQAQQVGQGGGYRRF